MRILEEKQQKLLHECGSSKLEASRTKKAILRQLWMLHSSITEEDFPMLLDNSHRAFFARKFLTNQPSELRSRVLHYSLAGGYYQRIKGNLCIRLPLRLF